MPSLQTIGRRFESDLFTDDGLSVPGVVLPLTDDPGVSYDFAEPRILIRLRHDSPVGPGFTLTDPAGRRYMLGDHDTNSIYNTVLYKTVIGFRVNDKVKWQRQNTATTDTLTGLKKSSALQDLGMIDVLIEMNMRERLDPAMKVREESHRLITLAEVKLGDIVHGMVVKRLNRQRGVWVGEIE